ncbi:GNAT family N-acetyltransferase [Saccharibacillus qingshengii]|uniref:GNAT family N-acetyltransferase n=1 Tax=Saccharibacillus qingshengii TaxID=1763540 RepID=UPI001555ED44|nr:GNAT family protein [Saccharibacillus qingshengii]
MITLQYFEPRDFGPLIRWSGDEAFLLQWSGPSFRFPLSEDQLAVYLNEANDPETSSTFIYKAVESSTGETVGHLSLAALDRYNRSARVGRVLLFDSHRGKGYGLQMMRGILRIGFEDFGLHRIGLGVFDFNRSALSCYEKAGFVREGLIRDSRRYGDSFWNLIEMGILEQEWRTSRSEKEETN